MSRLTIDVTEQQHQALKAAAALQSKTIKQYTLERLFPSISDENQALDDLKALLSHRMTEAMHGERSVTRPYVLTKGAAADIREITRYSVEKGGDSQCRAYIKQIEKAAREVATGKELFKDMSSLLPGLRVKAVGRHYIFCLPQASGPALILAILHERMDIVPVSATLVESVLSRQLDDLESALTRHGYRIKDVVEQFDAKPAEIKALFSNSLEPMRAATLRDKMLAAGLPI
ncbi:hypothetical protein DFQ28_011355 [Apophysomyces sp. BC1034]|nr:hypothetical protein DFQ30_011226 [Apophysomyces sp. BC1015]KAG0184347.1 hypothetical protein DFQ28_011355 [Apophysomyces sp. BC1034]